MMQQFVWAMAAGLFFFGVSQSAWAGSTTGPAFTGEESLRLSKPLPVIDQPFQIYVAGLPSDSQIQYVIKAEATGKAVADEAGAQTSGGIGISFTAPDTGYYTVTATSKNPARQWTLRFPVVHRDLHFTIWPPLQPEESGLRCLSTHVIVVGADKQTEEVDYWHRHGSRVLGATFTGGRQVDLKATDAANTEKLVTAWTKAMAGVCDGIYIDELGAYPNENGYHKVRIINDALKQFHKANSDKLIYAAVAGAPLLEQCDGLRSAGAVALLETYQSWLTAAFGTHRYERYLDQRIERARSTDLLNQRGQPNAAVIFIGYEGLNGGTTRPQLEETVRYIRKAAPAMPGAAFYASGMTRKWLHDTQMRQFVEELCERYYINPVLDLQGILMDDPTPQAGRATQVHVQIDNVGGMRARNVRINLYVSPVGLNERHKIDSVVLESVDVGFTDVADSSLANEEYKYVEVEGRKVPAFSKHGIVNKSRRVATFTWTPQAKGAYVLNAVVEPQDGATLLDGVVSRNVVVAGDAE